MSQHQSRRDRLVALRRDLHRRPEPAWREFYTTARIVEEIERIGVDEYYVGPEALAAGERLAVPDREELMDWLERARAAGASDDVLDELEGGYTGAVAVLRRGEGPTVGLRVDIDGLPREEADTEGHVPAAEGFRSMNKGAMHACGHDAHATIGLGVLDAVADSEFQGTLKVFFQPAEEAIAGGKPLAESGHLDDVDYLLAVHIGLDHPTGEVVAGLEGFLAVSQFRADFRGTPAHAGISPDEGANAIQAMSTAVQNLYAIPRHGDGATRVNAGRVGGGTATNIVAEEAFIVGEVRGKTTALRDYTWDRAERVVANAAGMHGCDVDMQFQGEAPSGASDPQLAGLVADIADGVQGVDSVVARDEVGGSEDATYLMQRVQDRGGLATYVCVGTDHPTGHHTATFDIDEASLPIGVAVLAGAIERIASQPP